MMDPNFSLQNVFFPMIGGALIGLSATLMLVLNGRVTGISGILSTVLSKPHPSHFWRYAFLLGLLGGGLLVSLNFPDALRNLSDRGFVMVAVAGLLVGYGTVMGSGCTSGHGICGISRLSIRSLVATGIFMLFGFLTVIFVRALTGGL
jgi:uncharacterized membrane protein YedE/YeeE